jgi:hypothetical protein
MMFPVLIGWIIGVPLAIWWPRPVKDDHPAETRAYATIRYAAACLLAAYALYMAVVFTLLRDVVGIVELLGIIAGFGAFMLSPLASCASALDVQRRSVAIVGSYFAALLTAGQTIFSFFLFLNTAVVDPTTPVWWRVCALASTLSAAVALALVLELYAMVRRNPTT